MTSESKDKPYLPHKKHQRKAEGVSAIVRRMKGQAENGKTHKTPCLKFIIRFISIGAA